MRYVELQAYDAAVNQRVGDTHAAQTNSLRYVELQAYDAAINENFGDTHAAQTNSLRYVEVQTYDAAINENFGDTHAAQTNSFALLNQMTTAAPEPVSLEDIEIELLLEGLFRAYGFDFRDYSRASLKRRILDLMRSEKLPTVSAFQDRILHDQSCLERVLLGLSVHATAMFRDPSFYSTFRKQVVPLLRTYPTVQIWIAGCSTGEEVYSLAILLQEEKLYEKCRIYATDISRALLRKARDGIFPLAAMRDYTNNYHQAGGLRDFSDYYTAQYDSVIFSSTLKTNLVFSEHNLATDGSFNEFQVILCRNVMIYFNKELQARVHNLLYDSLSMFGVFGLGNKESLKFTPRAEFYQHLNESDKLYRKVM